MYLNKFYIVFLILILLIPNPLFASNFGALLYLFIFMPIFVSEVILFFICIFGPSSNLYIKMMIGEFVFNLFISCWFGFYDKSIESFFAMLLPLLILNIFGFGVAGYKNRKIGSIFTIKYNEMEIAAAKLNNDQEIFINEVIDVFTLSAVGPKIKLIGLKLKNGIDPTKAFKHLERIVVNQIVQLEFDDGPKLDENGARRAFVYWVKPSLNNSSSLVSKNEDLITKNTLINTYLLNSELYELDLSTVMNEEWKRRLCQYTIKNKC